MVVGLADLLRFSLDSEAASTLPSDERVVLLGDGRVDWIEADGNYVRLHDGQETHFVRDTLRSLEAPPAGTAFRARAPRRPGERRAHQEVHTLPRRPAGAGAGGRCPRAREPGPRQRLEHFLRSV
jgi:hypothetical protein